MAEVMASARCQELDALTLVDMIQDRRSSLWIFGSMRSAVRFL